MLFLAPVIALGQAFSCTPVRVWDGDGPVWCAEGPRLRLAGIAAREIDGTCRPNQPCPGGSAEAARDNLVRLLGRPSGFSREGHILIAGPALRCVSTGGAGGDRTGAWCVTAAGVDLSCAMVASGFALRWPRYWNRHHCPDG
jgi:endonuclease YncB( thermonuclease family)